MRIIQRNVLQSIGAAVTSGIRLWKATAPTALHSDYAPERPERRSRMWAAGSRGSGSSELGIPPEISIYSDSGWDSSEPNVILEECNYNEGQSSNQVLYPGIILMGMTLVHQILTLMVNSETSYLIWNQLTLLIKSEILCLMWNQST